MPCNFVSSKAEFSQVGEIEPACILQKDLTKASKALGCSLPLTTDYTDPNKFKNG